MTRDFLKPQKTTGLDTNAPVGKRSRFAPDPFPTRLQPKPKQPDLQTLIQRGLRLGDPMAKAWANTQPTVQQEAMPEEEKEENLQMKADEAIQREELEEEETLQTKPESTIQRQELEQEEETLQTQSESTLQREELEEEEESVQTKLTIGQPGDKYEQEADNMAAKVMSMPDPTAQNIQRQEIAEEETLHQKPLADGITPVVQRQTSETQQQDSASQSLESQLAAEKGGGSPLSDEVRSFMEPRFGADFSEVRVHTGSAAVQMNQQLGAQAFTHGNDIYYGKGKAPGNDALTAHELTHTIQQTSSQIQPYSSPSEELLDSQQVENAIRYNRRRGYDIETIKNIQHIVGTASDGIFGSDTVQKVAQYQAQNNLDIDGMIGEKTLKEILNHSSVSTTDESTPKEATRNSPVSTTDESTPKKVTKTNRTLDFVTMKRKHIDLGGDDKYGHWWTEIKIDGGEKDESYGWWPKKRPVGTWDALFGTEGELNGQTYFNGTDKRDPHHGDPAPDIFHPVTKVAKTDETIKEDIRKFANGYRGEWRWTFGYGQNCHTFQEQLMSKVGLQEP